MEPVSVLAITESVRNGSLSAQKIVSEHLKRISELNGQLNAFTVVRRDAALSEATALDMGGPGSNGPLVGVPVAVKEEYDVAGCVTTIGGRGNSKPVDSDGLVIRKLREAGAVIIGKTNMPEFGQFAMTESEYHGITRNPWDTNRSPGGSSGGSAVAVATGMAVVGMSADGGGSIRIPASACGLIGLKPTRGRVSSEPLAEHWHGLAGFGPITRTVADVAQVMDVISGNAPTDRWKLDPPEAPFVDAAAQDPEPLRILGASNPVIRGTRVSGEIMAAANSMLQRLHVLGHRTEAGRAPWPCPAPAFLPLYFSGMRVEAGQMEHPELLERRTRTTAKLARCVTDPVLNWALSYGRYVGRALEEFFKDWDIILLPTIPTLPPSADAFSRSGWLKSVLRSAPLVSNTAIFNVSGHPAISIPGGTSSTGMPIGVQLVAAMGREDLLLSVAAQLERQIPWPTWHPRAPRS